MDSLDDIIEKHFELFPKYQGHKRLGKKSRYFFMKKHFPRATGFSTLTLKEKKVLLQCLQNKTNRLGCCAEHPILSHIQRNQRSRLVSINSPQWVKALKERMLQGLEKCVRCGSRFNLTLDHIVPISKGGRSDRGNLQVMCSKCNEAKADLVPALI